MSDAVAAMGPAFAYRSGELHAESVPVRRIADAVGTPFYCYSSAAIATTYRRFAAAFEGSGTQIHYALKANSNQAVIRTLARLGAGADVVSEGELRRALAAGIPPSRIIFSGVGKTETELAYALSREIHQINVESLAELELLSRVASGLGNVATISLRINPDVDAKTHAKISTGKRENKFGIDIDQAAAAYRRATTLPGLKPVGLAVHIGSQITELAPLEAAFRRMIALAVELREARLSVERLDFGGGLGVHYHAERPLMAEDYAALIERLAGNLGFSLACEPGRVLVANAGALIARVIYIKPGTTKSFVVQDAAMNDLIRPPLYEAWHEIVPVRAPASDHRVVVDVVGPVCETGDTFAVAREMPPVAAGDLLAILSAGAYGAVMSSSYNTRLLVPEVLVSGGEFAVVRPRPSYDELLGQDRIPPWLSGS
ncbi:MAG TPA: diaminopimelate decarboxylase [Stellaceae bacterium]|nr:diaminopimelate decarboxylase [Stellaceae bacterium]